MSKQLKEIQQELRTLSDKKVTGFIMKVAPGTAKAYGVKTPRLNELAVKYRPYSFELAEELWASGFLEERIIAIKILEKTGKTDPDRLFKLLQQFSGTIDNWAVCDGLGMQFLRSIVKTHAGEIFKLSQQFSRSKNFWQRRLSLVMLEWYTRLKEYHPAIKKLVKTLEKDEEYYVKKAVVWINRNFAKGK
jgi:3-methyladenine DNA glycosylase AlkD